MNNTDKQEKLKEIAAQFRKPEGKKGVEMIESMNETNRFMTFSCIDSLQVKADELILEIGPGNCSHLKELFSIYPQIHYTGLEISELMLDEATKINTELIANGCVSLCLYDETLLPFPDASFDKIYTVNTLYFWENPPQMLRELYRVLKPDGQLIITFSRKEYMETLPFTQFGFHLYTAEEATQLVEASPLRFSGIETRTDRVKNKEKESVERTFYHLKATRID